LCDNEALYLERNIARDAALFNPPKKGVTKAMAKEWKPVSKEEERRLQEAGRGVCYMIDPETGDALPAVQELRPAVGYKDNNRSVYLPEEFAELLKDLPFARVVLSGLTTMWLDSPDRDGCYERIKGNERLVMATVRATLGQICRAIGLPANGPNRMRVKRALEALHVTRYRNLHFWRAVVEGKRGKKHVEAVREDLTVLAPRLRFQQAVVNGKASDVTVIVSLCEPLTRALLLDTPKARIPLKVLKATYYHKQTSREMQNLLFYLAAVSPEKKGRALRFKEETLLGVMRPEGARRDKNLRRLERALDLLKKAGFLKWWRKENGAYLVKKAGSGKETQEEGTSVAIF